MDTNKKNYFRFFISLVLCLFARLIPVRVPNFEPILATTMPIGKAYGAFFSFSFGILSILLYDIITHTLGVQTFFTLFAYGVLGLCAGIYFKERDSSVKNYVTFAIVGTLFYDAITGLTVGPLVFHQSFMNALAGQIPFTLLHLTGNIIFALVLSPAIYGLLIKKKKKKETLSLIKTLNPKTI